MTKNLLDWELVADKGFGDKNNICAWSMAKYKDYLYVGTLNVVNGCQVYRSKTGDKGTWKQVNVDGFAEKSRGARTMLVFKNLLWVVTYSHIKGSQIWVTNGKDDKNGLIKWKKANLDGFGKGKKIPGARAIVVYKDKLYVGSQNIHDLPRVFRYDGPIEFNKIQPKKWTWINKDWKDDIDHRGDFSLIGNMANYKTSDGKDYIYAGFYSEVASLIGELKRRFSIKTVLKIIKFFTLVRCKIYRYDGSKWEEVSKPGFGRSNIMAMSVASFDEDLYFGTSNIFGAELWKTNDGVNWIQVSKRGFGQTLNISVWGLHVFKERLVIGIQNLVKGSQIWASIKKNPSSNKDFTQISSNFIYKKTQSKNKFKQDGVKTFEVFNGRLYAGTSYYKNVIKSNVCPGCEIWRINHL
ncbi:MAG: hypothetical protein BV457_02065 [Thermoplasmata archaeon M9B1D]|nr:MAG: hypothetical protein BV457_02065 [Thermoplasmata archaeon M9B1D]